MITQRAALFLRAVETLDVVETPEELFAGRRGRVSWISIERGAFDGLEPSPFVCATERHEGANVGADFVEALVSTAGRLCFWPACSVCHNTMRTTYEPPSG